MHCTSRLAGGNILTGQRSDSPNEMKSQLQDSWNFFSQQLCFFFLIFSTPHQMQTQGQNKSTANHVVATTWGVCSCSQFTTLLSCSGWSWDGQLLRNPLHVTELPILAPVWLFLHLQWQIPHFLGTPRTRMENSLANARFVLVTMHGLDDLPGTSPLSLLCFSNSYGRLAVSAARGCDLAPSLLYPYSSAADLNTFGLHRNRVTCRQNGLLPWAAKY